MSEFPFEGATTAGGPGAPAPSRTRTYVLAGALVAALGVGGGVLLLSGSGDSTTAAAPVVQPVRHRATPSATPAPVAPVVPVAAPVQGRNPYKALHVVPTGGAGSGSSSGPAGSPAPQSTAGQTVATAPPAATTTLSVTTATVKLVSIDRTDPTFPFATFSVSGKSYVVVPAQRFGATGDLVLLAFVKDKAGALTGALVQAGSADPVQVMTGKTITVP